MSAATSIQKEESYTDPSSPSKATPVCSFDKKKILFFETAGYLLEEEGARYSGRKHTNKHSNRTSLNKHNMI